MSSNPTRLSRVFGAKKGKKGRGNRINKSFTASHPETVTSPTDVEPQGVENFEIPVEIEPNENNFTFLPEGRRIINLTSFLNGLKSISMHRINFGCTFLNLNLIQEIRKGLNSKLIFKCNMCNMVFNMFTSDLEEKSSEEIHKEIVSGTMLAGNGYTQSKRVLEAVNVPFMSPRSYRKFENKTKAVWIQSAENQMKDAIEEEKKIAYENGNIDEDDKPLITVVTDGAWSHRSYGTKYSSWCSNNNWF
ncbi:uncharacterized protein LOC129907444 [Episyrphus balteatus]|uniref:uncharacterized protein LOC129907444 n=1 Tax=Episyrphus balteatus TaxID=286459 RepID=UPI0024859107|nr:uncharacterized protein LOC129907444 [Episyrphus balteatus]